MSNTITKSVDPTLLDALRGTKRCVAVCHERPDGDALGSLFGLMLGLARVGIEVTPKCVDPVPEVYRFLPGAERLTTHHERAADYERAMLVWHLLDGLGIEIDPETATNLYVGLLTDTGGFRYSNTDAETLRLAAELTEAGARPAELWRQVYESFSAERQRLLGETLRALELFDEGQVALSEVTWSMMNATGTGKEHTDGLVDHLRSIRGVEVAALLREDGPGLYKVSLRSNGRCDVEGIARRMNGGGHAKAAGATLKGDRAEVRRRLLEEIRTILP